MNVFLKFITLLSTMVLGVAQLDAQVTIGTSKEPAAGALLDLKQNNNTTGGATASLGLGLPRVTLTDQANLYPMFAGNVAYTGKYKDDEDAKHIGLVVYNVDVCSLSGKGIYVWTKNGWEILGNATGGGGGGLTVTPSSLMFYNGLNNPVYKKDVTVSWKSTNPADFSMEKDDSKLAFTASASGTTSPAVYSVSVPDMTDAELGLNLFQLKTGKMNFLLKNSPCGVNGLETKTVEIQQINKAIALRTIDVNTNTYVPDNVMYTNNTDRITGVANVESNAKWKVTGFAPNNSAISTMTLGGVDLKNTANSVDWENNDGVKGGEGKINVTVNTTGTTVNRYTYITLADANNDKRFADVTLTVLQCASKYNPTMATWKSIGGLDNVAIDIPNVNGLAWHEDQDGNIFLSGRFGYWDNTDKSERRWMVTNLAARSFAPAGTRTGDDKEIYGVWGYFFNGNSGKVEIKPLPNGSSTYIGAYWVYPTEGDGTSNENYVNNERNGILYNWNAATNGFYEQYMNANPQLPLPGNQAGRFKGYNRRQGICPNGWHLPSFSEYVDFFNELIANTSTYSNTPVLLGVSGGEYDDTQVLLPHGTDPNAASNGENPPYTFGINTSKKKYLGRVGASLKDYCSVQAGLSLAELKKSATSNPINSTEIPGFNSAFCGFSAGGTVSTPDFGAYYWSSSYTLLQGTSGSNSAAALVTTTTSPSATLNEAYAQALFLSVRCVKDYDAN